MIRINSQTKPKSAAVIMPLYTAKDYLYANRLATISHMSGYPQAVHVIGRVQRMFNLNSYEELLQSIIRLRDLVRITADVIDSMEGVKTDRFQLNKTEIIAYVENVAKSLQTDKAPSPEEVDLIAHLITSFEANQGAWILQGGDDTGNLHLMFKNLYKSTIGSDMKSDLPVYLSHSDKIDKLGRLPQFSGKGNKDNAKNAAMQLEDASVLYSLASTRVIDHIYNLLMDKEIWYAFISPRAKAELAGNLERSKSLKTFALYLQNILSYNQYFMLELFLQSYDLVQKWITHFPPLEASTLYKLDNIVRPHDILDARGDVASLIGSFTDDKIQTIADKLIVFPAELLGSMGIKKVVERLEAESSVFNIDAPIVHLEDLDRPGYLPLLSGVAVANFDVAYDLTQVLLVNKKVSGEIDDALAGLVPSLVRGSAKATVESLKALQLSAKLDFVAPHALQLEVTKGVEKGIMNGKLYLDSAAPQYSWGYHEFLRTTTRFKIFSDSMIPVKYENFAAKQVPDRDRAASYRDMIGYQWKSLVPAEWSPGAIVYTEAGLKSSKEQVRSLVEALTLKNYDIAIRELQVPHLQRIWATYLGSFALLYINSDELSNNNSTQSANKAEFSIPNLIEGYGRPFGATYLELLAKQDKQPSDPSDFIVIAPGIYLYMLDSIPVVTDDLAIEKSFFQEQTSMYFAANSGKRSVTHWVMDDSLLQLALFPVNETTIVPSVSFTAKFAYLTRGVFMNSEIFYKPLSPDAAREVSTIKTTKKEWPFDRHQYFLDYVTFGNYGADRANIDTEENPELIVTAVKKIEAAIVADNVEAVKHAETAGAAMKETAKNVALDVAKNTVKNSPADDDKLSIDKKD